MTISGESAPRDGAAGPACATEQVLAFEATARVIRRQLLVRSRKALVPSRPIAFECASAAAPSVAPVYGAAMT